MGMKVYGEGWRDFTPSYDMSGSGGYDSVTTHYCRYRINRTAESKSCQFQIHASGETTTPAGPWIGCTVPIGAANVTSSILFGFAGHGFDGDHLTISGVIVDVSGTHWLRVYHYDGGDWGLGTNRQMIVHVEYEIV